MKLVFEHAAFIVSDLDGSIQFYQDVLGLKVVAGPREVGAETPFRTVVGYAGARVKWVHLGLDSDRQLELIQYMIPEGKKTMEIERCDVGAAHSAFVVDNLKKYYEELTAKGVRSVQPPAEDSHGNTAVYMFDPDGFVVEFIEKAK